MSSTAIPLTGGGPLDRSIRAAAQSGQLTYRPDIDGLRAVAVLAVIGFHAFPDWIPGGFVGVDVFFVISGYLITTIIVGQLNGHHFSYRYFYARRIKRILPALLVVLAAAWIAGWVRLFPDEYRQFGKQMAASAAFMSNVLRTDSGYFDDGAETKPLLHLWSLAIEEQFYIFWPLLLGIPMRFFRSPAVSKWVIVTSAVASFVFGMATLDARPTLAFYSPFARFWELMIGGMLAQQMLSRPAWFGRFREVRSIAGFAMVFGSLLLYARGVPYPGWRALMPTVGAYLVISAGPNTQLNRWVLGNSVTVWVGKLSYPLYLWHWPLLSFLFIEQGTTPSLGVRLSVVTASILLAWLTCRFVERPVRRSRNFGTLPLALLVSLAIAGIIGSITHSKDGFANRFGPAGAFVASFDNALPELRFSVRHDGFAAFREDCNFYDVDAWRNGGSTNLPRAAIAPSCYLRPEGTKRAVLLWGDSHAEHLNIGLRAALPSDVALLQVASWGCSAAIVEPSEKADFYCRKSNQFALATIRKEKPDVVLIAQRSGHTMAGFRRIAAILQSAGVRRVVVLGPIPQWKPALNKVIAAHYWDATPDRMTNYLDPDTVAIEHRLKGTLKPDEPFIFLDLFDALCDQRGCRTYVDGDRIEGLMTSDYGHLTPRASMFVGRTIVGPVVLKALDETIARP